MQSVQEPMRKRFIHNIKFFFWRFFCQLKQIFLAPQQLASHQIAIESIHLNVESITKNLEAIHKDIEAIKKVQKVQKVQEVAIQTLEEEVKRRFETIYSMLHCRPNHLSTPFLISEGDADQSIGFDDNKNNIEIFNYLSFENVFRGSEELIKERQRCYLPFFEGKKQVLDIGSGRGEFLELVMENNILGTGIELNQDMVKYCKKKGIQNVICSDGNSFLRQVPQNEKMEGIFSAQVIEHLEFDYLFEFLQLSYNALVDGGVFIAETINPHCTQAVKLFYLDLSHVKPIFPETLLFLLKNIGFSKAKIFFPYRNSFSSNHIFEEGDYAVIAWK